MKKIDELRKKPKEELQKILKDDREKTRQLRFDLAAGKVKNVREIRRIKKEISQILTILAK
jgi:ribosomal protein L29